MRTSGDGGSGRLDAGKRGGYGDRRVRALRPGADVAHVPGGRVRPRGAVRPIRAGGARAGDARYGEPRRGRGRPPRRIPEVVGTRGPVRRVARRGVVLDPFIG